MSAELKKEKSRLELRAVRLTSLFESAAYGKAKILLPLSRQMMGTPLPASNDDLERSYARLAYATFDARVVTYTKLVDTYNTGVTLLGAVAETIIAGDADRTPTQRALADDFTARTEKLQYQWHDMAQKGAAAAMQILRSRIIAPETVTVYLQALNDAQARRSFEHPGKHDFQRDDVHTASMKNSFTLAQLQTELAGNFIGAAEHDLAYIGARAAIDDEYKKPEHPQRCRKLEMIADHLENGVAHLEHANSMITTHDRIIAQRRRSMS